MDENDWPNINENGWPILDENIHKVTVMKFDGANWVTVGSPAFTPSGGSWTSIVIDNDGNPLVAFRDMAHNYRASVMKFDGTNWNYVGVAGFSPMGTGVQGASYFSIKINKNNQPILAFSDLTDDFKASVMEFDGSAWNYVGAPGFSTWQASTTSLVMDHNGSPYVAYWDRANDGKATVMKFNGASWVPVVSPGITPGAAEFTSLAIDKHDNLYLAYTDYANGQKASVMKYDGNSWTSIGTGLSPTRVFYTSVAVDNNENVYVTFQDLTDYYGGWQFPHWRGKGVMLKSPQGISSEIANASEFNVYPNPGSTFNISYTGKFSPLSISIKNQLGQIITSKNYGTQDHLKETLNLTSYGKGIYFVEFTFGEAKEVRKIVVE